MKEICCMMEFWESYNTYLNGIKKGRHTKMIFQFLTLKTIHPRRICAACIVVQTLSINRHQSNLCKI